MQPFSRFSRYFLEVARLGSLRRAAEALHVSASAIDRQILMAERELKSALFERLPAGMRLTAAGELLLADLRRWNKDYGRTLERFDELRGLRRGQISVAAIDALSEGLLVDVIAQAGKTHPQLKFEVSILENRRVAELVAEAEVDFGLLLDPVEHGGLEVRAMTDIPLGVVLPVGHPLAGERRLAYSQLLDYRLIVPAAPLIVEQRTRSLQATHGDGGNHVLSCDNIRMIRALVRGGSGIGVLSLLDVAVDVAEGRLAFVPLQGRKIKPLQLALCVAPRRQLSRAAQFVIEHIAQAMKHFPRQRAVA